VKRIFLTLLTLALAILACRKATPCEIDQARCTPTPPPAPPATAIFTPTATSVHVETHVYTATPQAAIVTAYSLNVHETPGGTVTGWLYNGDTVTVIETRGDWALIQAAGMRGYVWRGCLSDNLDLRCEESE
jgi:uncharacterized protein YgiM (DUF1202 family)